MYILISSLSGSNAMQWKRINTKNVSQSYAADHNQITSRY
jgi:hypothetical protein